MEALALWKRANCNECKMNYLYFRFFKLAKFFTVGINDALYRAASTSSLMTFFNVQVLLDLFGMGITKGNLVYFFIAFVLWYYLALKYFLNANRYRKVMTQFRGESLIMVLIGNLITLLYIASSVILFIMSFTKF